MQKIYQIITAHYSRLSAAAISLYFLCALEVYTMFHYVTFVPTGTKLLRYLLYLCFIVLAFAGYIRRHKISSLTDFWSSFLLSLVNHLLFVFLFFMAAMVYISSGSLIPMAFLLIFLVLQYASLREVLLWIFWSQVAAMAVIICLSLAGVLENLSYPTFLRGVRYSLGYIFPLELHAHFLMLVLLGLYLYPKMQGWKSLVLITVLNFGLYHFTIARTSFYLGEAAAVLSFLCGILPQKQKNRILSWKGWKILIPVGTVAVFLGFILLCGLYDPAVIGWERIDDVLSGRLRLGRAALETYPLTLFGQRIAWVGSGGPEGVYVWESSYNYVDNSYIKDLLDYGLIFWIVEMLSFIWLQLRFIQKKNLMGLFLIWITFLIGMMEPRLILLPFSVFLLLLEPAALAANSRVEAWFAAVFPLPSLWKKMPVFGRAVLVLAVAAVAVFGFLQLRQSRIYSTRREYGYGLISSRQTYTDRLWQGDAAEYEDPYSYRKALLEAVENTDSYEREALKLLPDTYMQKKISDSELKAISDLSDQKAEKLYLEVLDGDEPVTDELLAQLRAAVSALKE